MDKNNKRSYLHIEATHNLAVNCINSFLHAKSKERRKHVSRQQVVVRSRHPTDGENTQNRVTNATTASSGVCDFAFYRCNVS